MTRATITTTATTAIDLKALVRDAVVDEWPAFAHRHPNLAACLDQDLLVASASRTLADDPEYRAAMDQAAAVGLVATSAAGIVRTFVADFLRRLMG